MAMQFKDRQSSGVERRIQVSVPVDTVRDAEDKAAKRYATRVRLPGFRPGKAPPAMVRKKFADAIRQEALEALVRDAYQELVSKQDLELKPTIQLARTTGFRITRPKIQVTDEQLREQLEHLREDKAVWSPSEEKPQPGDMVRVSIATADEGAELPE